MHLLLAQPGEVTDGSEAVDLSQTPAELIVISAADTELAAMAEARAALGSEAPELRLASLMHLTHPMSVDLYLDQTATKARLVVARVLGSIMRSTTALPSDWRKSRPSPSLLVLKLPAN